MNREKRNIEISPTIVEQLSEEPTKYWRGRLRHAWKTVFTHLVLYSTERAAWIDREACLRSGEYISIGTPLQVTRDEANALAVENGLRQIRIYDETLTVVDSWSVA